MSQEFSFDLQQVVESDFLCADGVCFVPTTGASTGQADTHAGPSRD